MRELILATGLNLTRMKHSLNESLEHFQGGIVASPLLDSLCDAVVSDSTPYR